MACFYLHEKVRKEQESSVLLQEEKENLHRDNARMQTEIVPMAVEKQKELTAEKDKFNSSISLKNEEIKQLKIFSINRIKKLELVIYSPMRWVQLNWVKIIGEIIKGTYIIV